MNTENENLSTTRMLWQSNWVVKAEQSTIKRIGKEGWGWWKKFKIFHTQTTSRWINTDEACFSCWLLYSPSEIVSKIFASWHFSRCYQPNRQTFLFYYIMRLLYGFLVLPWFHETYFVRWNSRMRKKDVQRKTTMLILGIKKVHQVLNLIYFHIVLNQDTWWVKII